MTYCVLNKIFKKFEDVVEFGAHELKLSATASPIYIFLIFLRPFRNIIIASAITGMILAVFELAKLWAVSYLVDSVAYSKDFHLPTGTLLTFGIIIASYALLDPLIWLVHYMLRMQSLTSQTRASAQWQSHKAATRHDLAYFNTTHAGQIAGRIGQIAGSVQAGAELLAGRFPVGFIRFVGSAILVSYLAPLFLMPVIIWIILNGMFAIWLVPQFNTQTQKVAETASMVNGSITEYFSNIRAIKTSFAYAIENAHVLTAIKKQNFNYLEINRLTTFTGLAIRVLNTGLVAVILALGIHGLNMQTVSAGEFVAGVTLASGMAADAGWFVAIWEGMTQTLGVIKDAQVTIAAHPKIIDTKAVPGRFQTPPSIEFSDVSFSYDDRVPVLNRVNLEIRPGEKVGIVGPSGAGKSTLIDLLLRLYDVSSGEVKVNGINVKSVSLAKLRNTFGVVSQGDALFHRSITDNISIGVDSFTAEEIVNAANMADASQFIDDLKSGGCTSGYDVVVGERGAKLSGGQQQRILLARAFLQKRPILILDEATSALDSNSESLIQQAISAYSRETTVIAVAHRLATIKDFDKIVVLDGGSIVGIGNHQDLIASNSLYRSLWEKQSEKGS